MLHGRLYSVGINIEAGLEKRCFTTNVARHQDLRAHSGLFGQMQVSEVSTTLERAKCASDDFPTLLSKINYASFDRFTT